MLQMIHIDMMSCVFLFLLVFFGGSEHSTDLGQVNIWLWSSKRGEQQKGGDVSNGKTGTAPVRVDRTID